MAMLSIGWATIAAGFAILWWRQTRTRNATSVDAAWTLAIGGLALWFAATGTGALAQRLTAAVLAGLWSGRLGWHLVRDRVFGHTGEDGRYRALRDHWGARASANFFWFYQLQAFAAVVFAAPFWFIAGHQATALTPVQGIGLGVFLIAQVAEAIADRQLARFRRDPTQRGRTCRAGMWRYSRHPNYFCEWLSWCGIALVALPAAGWLAAVQPVLMLVLVRFVSGVPFNELQALKSRGDDYRRYQVETNAFVPWWPRAASRSAR